MSGSMPMMPGQRVPIVWRTCGERYVCGGQRLDGSPADDLDHHELGAVLVHPYRIVSVTPTPEHVITAILA